MITSLTNEKIKKYARLLVAKERAKEQCFLIEGEHLVTEAKAMGLLVEKLTTVENDTGLLVSPQVMKKLSNTVSTPKVMGVCRMPKCNEKLSNRILILDGISDPTNLGTLLRSAKAFGFNTIFASNQTVDYFNDKVIRGSQGAIFKLNLLKGDVVTFINKIKPNYRIYGTNVRRGEDVASLSSAKAYALVLGNEAKGVSPEVEALCDLNLFIKMEKMESLNVSVAGAILMYELAKK